MDVHEVDMMFTALDTSRDGLLNLHELVSVCLGKTANGVAKDHVPEVIEALSKKTAFREEMSRELFAMSYKVIMAELSMACQGKTKALAVQEKSAKAVKVGSALAHARTAKAAIAVAAPEKAAKPKAREGTAEAQSGQGGPNGPVAHQVEGEDVDRPRSSTRRRKHRSSDASEASTTTSCSDAKAGAGEQQGGHQPPAQ